MQLPGGLVEGGTRQRAWAFRPLSGALELALSEVRDYAEGVPQAVTRTLSLALAGLGGAAATPERVAALCVADRQFLMRELEHHLGSHGGWFGAECSACAKHFDFHLDYAELPVQEAAAGYPEASLDVDGQAWRLRLPNGADQAAVAELADPQAVAALLQRLTVAGAPPATATGDWAAAAEAALEAVAPAIVLSVQAGCPECGASNTVALDPYAVLARPADALLHEVHQLAQHYHWSEADILGLPRNRRQHYLQLVDHARGMVT